MNNWEVVGVTIRDLYDAVNGCFWCGTPLTAPHLVIRMEHKGLGTYQWSEYWHIRCWIRHCLRASSQYGSEE